MARCNWSKSCKRSLAATVQRYEGRVVKFFGDAVLAEFPSTEMAVRAAAVLSKQVR